LSSCPDSTYEAAPTQRLMSSKYNYWVQYNVLLLLRNVYKKKQKSP